LIAGLGAIAIGINAGLEWLEIPWPIGGLFAIGGMLIGLPMATMLQYRRTQHLYVSVWYVGAALFWFPTLYIVAKMPGLHFGVEQATMNWVGAAGPGPPVHGFSQRDPALVDGEVHRRRADDVRTPDIRVACGADHRALGRAHAELPSCRSSPCCVIPWTTNSSS